MAKTTIHPVLARAAEAHNERTGHQARPAEYFVQCQECGKVGMLQEDESGTLKIRPWATNMLIAPEKF